MQPDDSGVRSTATLTYAVAILSLVTLLAIFSQTFVLIPLNLSRLVLPFTLSISAALSAFSVGFAARRLLAIISREPAPLPLITRDLIIGYPLFGGLVYLLSLIAIRPELSAIVLIAGSIAGAALLSKWNMPGTRETRIGGVSDTLAVLLLAICGLLSLIVAQMPAISLDETAYHLAVPRIWVNEGHVVDLPLLSHSSFPLGTESVDVLFLSILGSSGAIASHFLHLLVAIATVSILFHSFRDRGAGSRETLILLAAIVTTPALIITAGWSGTDWPLVGCVLLLLDALRFESAAGLAAAIAAGMLTKFTFLPFLLVSVPIAFAAATHRRRFVLATLAGSLFGSLFLVRNLVTRGNPFAPFFSSSSPSLGGFHAAPTFAGTIRNYLFDGALVDDSLGVGLVCCLLIALLWLATALRTPAERALFAGLSLITLLLSSRLPASRLLLPYLVALLVVSTRGVVAALHGAESLSWIPRMLRGLLVLSATAQLGVFVYYADSLDPLSVITGRHSESDLSHALRRDSSAVEALDNALPPQSRTLVLGVNELFGFTHPVRGGGNFDSASVSRYLERSSIDTLRNDGMTHLALFDSLAFGTESVDPRFRERSTTISPAAGAALRKILAEARPASSFPGGQLYKLVP